MPPKGWRKQVKPLEGPLREDVERWLDAGGYAELKLILIKEFGPEDERVEELVHEVVEAAMNPTSWTHFDRTKRKKNAVGYQLKMILWRRLINYRTYNYDKELPYSLTTPEGIERAIPEHSYTQVGAHIDLGRAVESLDEPYRSAFILIAQEGYTIAATARALNMRHERAEVAYETARRILYGQLQAYAHSD
jgi:DNA-directed RNA polymerase specialized sigma24 family protein